MKKISINELIELKKGNTIILENYKNGAIGICKIFILGEEQIAIGYYGGGTNTYTIDYITEDTDGFIEDVKNSFNIDIEK